jgi:hypothetical protein
MDICEVDHRLEPFCFETVDVWTLAHFFEDNANKALNALKLLVFEQSSDGTVRSTVRP